MVTDNYRWSLGTLIWLPICALLVAVLIALTVFLIRVWKKEKAKGTGNHDAEPGLALAIWIIVAVCAVSMVVFTAIGMWPYKAEYHQWQETVGVVEKIDSRLLTDSSGGATERFVVTFDTGLQRSCDDTRCAQVEVGDTLTLDCKRHYQWAGSHGYDCNYVSYEPQPWRIDG